MDNKVCRKVRDEFSHDTSNSHGDSAIDLRAHALGHMPIRVERDIANFSTAWARDNMAAWFRSLEEGSPFFDRMDFKKKKPGPQDAPMTWWNLSEKLARHLETLLHAEPGSCAFVPSVTNVFQQILSAPELNNPEKRKVVTSDREFPTVYDVLHGQNHRFLHHDGETRKKVGLEIAVAKMGDEPFDVQKILEYIDDKTTLVVVPHVASFTGELLSDDALAQIVEKAEKHSAYVLVDGSQAIGSTVINVQKYKPHFYAGTLLKQGCGGPGNGFVYARPDIAIEPTAGGWVGVADPFSHDDVGRRRRPHDSVPRRIFGVGTPAIAPLYHAVQGLMIFERIGYGSMVEDIRAKALHIRERLLAANLPLISPRENEHASALLVLRVADAPGFRDKLEDKGLLVTGQENIVRFAPHVYNSAADIREATQTLISTYNL